MSLTEGTDNLIVQSLVVPGSGGGSQGALMPNVDQDAYTRLGGTFRESTPRFAQTGVFASNNSGSANKVLGSAIPLWAEEVVNGLTFVSGATAATSPTRMFAALYQRVGTGIFLVATTPATAGGFGANTLRRFAFSTPITIQETGLYYGAVAQVAGVPASMTISPTTVHSQEPHLTFRANELVYFPEDCPQQIGSYINFGGLIYVGVD